MSIQKIFIFSISLFFWQLAQAQLHNTNPLQTKIQTIKSSINQAETNQTTLHKTLRDTEIKIGDISFALHKTQQALKAQQQQMQHLDVNQNQYQSQVASQQAVLAEQLRTIYMIGHPSYLQVLLNQQNANQFSRMLVYYHYLVGHRIKLIQQYNQTLTVLNQTQQQIQQQAQQLLALENQQEAEKIQLEKQQQQRQQLLHSLHHEIQTKQQQLENLLANKHAFEQVVTHLQKAQPPAKLIAMPKHHQGKFPWPTLGNVIEHYGTAIDNSQLKTTSVVIKAPAAQKVYAVGAGTVVFADWMKGYGLLLIIDHNNGWMSIYGRNQSLYKKVGEQVKAGELIATVGSSGGFSTPGLYFALRHDGKPENPQQWCG
jgi:septal ring factor EnvC (AmiA/AmiB activator)